MGFFTPDPEPSNSTFGSIDPSLFYAPINWNTLPFGLASALKLAPPSFRLPGQLSHSSYEELAANEPPCMGGWCQSGGSWGTSGMYKLLGKTYCPECAAKEWGITELPGAERARILEPYLMRPGD